MAYWKEMLSWEGRVRSRYDKTREASKGANSGPIFLP